MRVQSAGFFGFGKDEIAEVGRLAFSGGGTAIRSVPGGSRRPMDASAAASSLGVIWSVTGAVRGLGGFMG
jgi:hypothetical protein